MGKTACVTGHRPNKLGGYHGERAEKIQADVSTALKRIITELVALGYDRFISGGAVGVDQLFILAVLELREMGMPISLTIAKPFPSQDSKWPKKIQEAFQLMCANADEVVNVSDDPYEVAKMYARNHWMVDKSETVIGVYNGGYGGTKECLDYARKQGKAITVINPYTLVEKWENVA